MIRILLVYAATVMLASLSARYFPVSELGEQRRPLLRRADPFCALIILIFTLFSGLRTAYNDTETYISLFREGQSGLLSFLRAGEYGLAESPLFYALQALFKGIIDNVHLWFLFLAWISAREAVLLFREYSVDLPFTILLYQAIGTQVLSFAALRQGLATAVLMCAVPFLLRRRWIPYYLLTAAAILIHPYAAVFLLLPLFRRRPWRWETFLVLGLAVISIVFYRPVFTRIRLLSEAVGVNLPESELFDGNRVNPVRLLVYAIPAVFSFLFRERLFRDSDEGENLAVNMSIFSAAILSVGLANGANLFGRMAGYFEWGGALALPWMLNKAFSERDYRRMRWLAFLFYTLYFVFDLTVSKDFGASYRALGIREVFLLT